MFLKLKLQKFALWQFVKNPDLLPIVDILGISKDIGAWLFLDNTPELKVKLFQPLVLAAMVEQLLIGLFIELTEVYCFVPEERDSFLLNLLPVGLVHVHCYCFSYKVLRVVAADYLFVKRIILFIEYLYLNYLFQQYQLSVCFKHRLKEKLLDCFSLF